MGPNPDQGRLFKDSNQGQVPQYKDNRVPQCSKDRVLLCNKDPVPLCNKGQAHLCNKGRELPCSNAQVHQCNKGQELPDLEPHSKANQGLKGMHWVVCWEDSGRQPNREVVRSKVSSKYNCHRAIWHMTYGHGSSCKSVQKLVPALPVICVR